VSERFRLKLVTAPDEPELAALSALMNRVFPDPNSVLGLDRMQEFLAANRADAARRFCILVATDTELDGAVVAGSVFSHVVASNCGFSEYLVADRSARGQGLGRRLVDARKAVLDAEAQRHGHSGCRGVFIEVDSPVRTPPELAAAESETALDAWERLRLFDHLGFRRVDAPYIQPPLAPDKQAVDYLDLLFAAWDESAATGRRIPAQWMFDTLEAIWSAWTPETYSLHLAMLKQQIQTEHVALSALG
jgi:GNAT superfamily N-acetyltransferase